MNSSRPACATAQFRRSPSAPPLASFIDLTSEHGQKNPQNRQGLAIMKRWAKKHAAQGAEHVRRTQNTSNADRRVTLLGFKPPNIAKSLPATFDILRFKKSKCPN